MFSVALKPGHPTGVRHRAGLVFSASAPTLLEEIPEAVRADAWLIVTDVVPASIPSPSKPEGKGETEGDETIREKRKGRWGSAQ